MKRAGLYISFVIVMLVAASCRHKDLYEETGHTTIIDVVFDWRNAPQGNPESMVLYLYNVEGGQPLRYVFTGREGGTIRLPFGKYNSVCINGDGNDWARLRNNDDIEAFEVYTDDASYLTGNMTDTRAVPYATGTESQRMVNNPGMFWTDRSDGFELKVTDRHKTLTLYPEEGVCHYTVDVVDVQNPQYINDATIDATISGVAEGYYGSRKQPTEHQAIMPFVLTPGDDGTSLHGEFLTFGQCASSTHENIITLYLHLSDGSGRYYTYQATDQVDAADDPHHVHIVIRGFTLPKPIVSGGGLRPDVEDWVSERIPLPML